MKATVCYNGIKKEYALSSINLAKIGALEDFYDAYKDIKCVYEQIIAEGKERAERLNEIYTYDDVEEEAKKKVRKICDDLLNKHHFIFRKDFLKLYTNSFGFKFFTLVDKNIYFIPNRPMYEFTHSIASFEKFLDRFQCSVTRVLYYEVIQTQPKYDFERFAFEENEYIEKFVEKYKLNQDDDAIYENDNFSPWLNDFDPENIDNLTNFIESNRFLKDEKHELTKEQLFVYRNLSSVGCHRKHHPISMEVYSGLTISTGSVIHLPVHYCKQCKKYYIGEVTYSLYTDIYGTILSDKCYLDKPVRPYRGRMGESRLHRLGYIAEEGGLSQPERRKILVYLVVWEIMTYEEICRTINNDIAFFQEDERMINAVEKWRGDLKFISDFCKALKIIIKRNQLE